MAIQHHHHQQQNHPSFLLDALYCEEEKWEEEENVVGVLQNAKNNHPFLFPLLEQDLFWEDEELLSLFRKEKQQHSPPPPHITDDGNYTFVARREAVQWVLRVNSRNGFTTLTAVLAINYLDRFLSSFHFQRDKPWMIQLLAVTCLSLAAKVEETLVPHLLDLQSGESKYVFQAKTIQRMELLVLSTLQWKMHPVTPLSFLDHIMRRLELKSYTYWEFVRRCDNLLLCLISDSRSVLYLPSVMAIATMMHVINQVETFNSFDYQTLRLGVLKISKEKVNDCYKLIVDLSTKLQSNPPPERKFEGDVPSRPSPSRGVDGAFNSDRSNGSWAFSPEPPLKKSRAQGQGIRMPLLNRVFVDIVGNDSPS